ncbi:MAG: NADH-quinone oxidoreductase subunit M [Bacteroidota bacterium]
MDRLSLLIWVPAATMLLIALFKDPKKVRWIAAVGMAVQMAQILVLLFAFFAERNAGNTSEMLFVTDVVWYESLNIHYAVGIDGVSMSLLLLTGVVIFVGIFASWEIEDRIQEFFITLILLATGVFGFFISIDLFTMFLFYEVAVIPMYLLIGIWGSGPKEYSAMKLTLMLMGASAFLLVGILGIYFNSAPDGGELTFNFIEISKIHIPDAAQYFFFPLTFVGFAVLAALYPFHTWSPDGHASAPTAVSMLHAGVLMKLGGYGALRIAVMLMPVAAQSMAWIFIILATIGSVYGALGAVAQKDLKYINAYSSVSHLGLILFATMMFNQVAFEGAVLQMISHGLITALFFALIGMIYSRTHTRNIYEMGGILKVMPVLGVAYIVVGFASLGLPGFSAFVAEMTIFVGAFQNNDMFIRVATILVVSSIVITAVYILRAAAIMLMGQIKNKEFELLQDARWYDKVAVFILIAVIAGMGMFPGWLADMIFNGLTPTFSRFIAN